MFRRSHSKTGSTEEQVSAVSEKRPEKGASPGFVRVMRGYDPCRVNPYLAKLDAEIATLREQLRAADGQPEPADSPRPGPEDEVPDFYRVMRGYDLTQVDKHIAQQVAIIRDLRAQLQGPSAKP